MNRLFHAFVRPLLLALALTTTAPAAVIYSGVQNIAIPLSFDGVYVNIVTNNTSLTEPGNWTTAPWINPFWGGTVIGSNDQVRPSVISGTAGAEQIVNHAFGSEIGSTAYFASGYNGSETHIGASSSQFQIEATGYIGFTFDLAGDTHYGWMRMTPGSGGAGIVHDWAYNSLPDEGIYAGLLLGIPEPSRALLLILGMSIVVLRRRRAR